MIFKDPRQLKDTIKNKEKELKLPSNTLINYYMMDRFIEHLYHSKYRKNFVIKGGFLISSLIGINMRSTMDIDTTVKGLAIDQNSIEKIIEEILSIELDDNINWHIEKIINIHEIGEYEDFRVTLIANFFNMKVAVKIDITTGDLIIPREIDYSYLPIFSDEEIYLKAYPITSILAEKIESILVRNILNTRARDYYDVYTLLKLNPTLDMDKLLEAVKAKAKERETLDYFINRNIYIDAIKESEDLRNIWKNYQRKNEYAKNISWEEILASIETFRYKT